MPFHISKSMYLDERIRSFPEKEPAGSDPDDYTLKRIQHWINGLANREDLFNQQLSLHKIDRRKLLHLIEHPHTDEELFNNDQWFEVKKALDSYDPQNPDLSPFLTRIISSSPQEPIQFFYFLLPFLNAGTIQLQDRLKRSHFSLISEQAVLSLIKSLGESLLRASMRTMFLELNIARISNKLQGDDPEKRYRDFAFRLLRDPSYLTSIFEQYPVLIRLMCLRVSQWVEKNTEIFERLEQDRKQLEETMFGRDCGKLVQVESGISDPHRGGRGVAILTFESGDKVVYKPRPLQVDQQFQELLSWYNHLKDDGLPLHILNLIDCGEYGWTEYIPHKGCDDEEEVRRFYRRLGQQLALLYAINAIDFHNENLIASGEHPVLIDLETLFYQDIYTEDNTDTAFQKCLKQLGESVLASNILPVMTLFNEVEGRGINISAMGNEDQLSPQKVNIISNSNTDSMKIRRDYQTIEAAKNSPTLQGKKLDLTRYTNDLIQGFDEGYHVLTSNKAGLKHQVSLFSELRVRQILRPTYRYSSLLSVAFHPDYLRDGLDREMLFGKLWLDVEAYPVLKRVIATEKTDLLHGDIPYFTSKPGSTDLWDSRGQKIENFYKEPCMSRIMAKIDRMGEADHKEQKKIIKMSLLALNPGKTSKTLSFVPTVEDNFDRVAGMEEAKRIADYILERSIEGMDGSQPDICWIGMRLSDNAETLWRISPVGNDLYDGLSGIGLFFSHLYQITGEKSYRSAIEKMIVPIRSELRKISKLSNYQAVGAFTGATGYAYTFIHLANSLGNRELLEDFKPMVPLIREAARNDEALDFIDGAAGSLSVFLDLYHITGDDQYREVAVCLGDRLVEQASPQPEGVGWIIPSASQALPGFSHGVAGIAWSLMRLYKETKQENYLHTLQEGLRYERSFKKNNWVKDLDGLERMPCAWCHGAPGIVLSRLLLKEAGYEDEHLDHEIQTGLNALVQQGFGADHSLCHGDLGNADILLIASRVLKESKWREQARNVGNFVLRDIRESGWKTGIPGYMETCGLMVGLSGIGYGLLRMLEPEGVSSVLYLETPSTRL